jgi:hypothetical protein
VRRKSWPGSEKIGDALKAAEKSAMQQGRPTGSEKILRYELGRSLSIFGPPAAIAQTYHPAAGIVRQHHATEHRTRARDVLGTATIRKRQQYQCMMADVVRLQRAGLGFATAQSVELGVPRRADY